MAVAHSYCYELLVPRCMYGWTYASSLVFRCGDKKIPHMSLWETKLIG